MKELLFSLTKEKGDFKIETFTAGGKGGQHQNKTESGVRIIHIASGISAESRTERSQHQNKKIAFKNLVNKPEFKKWLRLEAARKSGKVKTEKEVRQIVEEQMLDTYLTVEFSKDGKWVKE